MKNKRLLVNDFLLLAFFVVLFAVTAFFIYGSGTDGAYVIEVYCGNTVEAVFSPDTDTVYKLNNADVVVEISGGEAYVSHSDCADKLCVGSAHITGKSPDGASIVCLPNKVAVVKRTSMGEGKEVDLVAG